PSRRDRRRWWLRRGPRLVGRHFRELRARLPPRSRLRARGARCLSRPTGLLCRDVQPANAPSPRADLSGDRSAPVSAFPRRGAIVPRVRAPAVPRDRGACVALRLPAAPSLSDAASRCQGGGAARVEGGQALCTQLVPTAGSTPRRPMCATLDGGMTGNPMIGIYDFSYGPFALGDALTWTMNLNVGAAAAGCDAIDEYLVIN